MTHDITLVGWTGLPDGSPDDRILLATLTARGVRARLAAWDDPAVDWSASPVTVVRSPANYYHVPDAFTAWLARVDPLTRLVNDAATVLWNARKIYLADLATAGVRIVPTVFVGPSDPADLDAIRAERGWDEVVIKPAIAASAHGARRFGPGEGGAHLCALVRGGVALVQPFLPEVGRARERCLVHIAGRLSHAWTKPPFNAALAGISGDERAHEPAPEELALARACLAAAPHPTTIARVDMVPTASGPLLMELELLDPALCLYLAPGAAERLADALLGRID